MIPLFKERGAMERKGGGGAEDLGSRGKGGRLFPPVPCLADAPHTRAPAPLPPPPTEIPKSRGRTSNIRRTAHATEEQPFYYLLYKHLTFRECATAATHHRMPYEIRASRPSPSSAPYESLLTLEAHFPNPLHSYTASLYAI